MTHAHRKACSVLRSKRVFMHPQSATVISEMFQAANRNKSHEAWMTISTYLLGEGVPSGAFLNLTKLVAVDSQINWPGLMPILRTGGGLMFASEVYALPITAFTSQIMYRKDVFAKVRRRTGPPRTAACMVTCTTLVREHASVAAALIPVLSKRVLGVLCCPCSTTFLCLVHGGSC